MTRRALLWCAALLLLPPVVYLLLAGVFGLIGVNRDFHATASSEGGVAIYLRTNGVHADIVLPTRSSNYDWSRLIPASQMRSLAHPTPWIEFGWGDRAFMLETPTWHDLRLSTSIKALAGWGPSAMHVEYVARPRDYDVAELHISEAQHERLLRAILQSFRRRPDGRVIRIDAPGYFDTDAFFDAVPSYSLRLTCNEWVRSVASEAGLPMPAWAPFEGALFWHLPDTAARRM
jgi:uncharacterized protein (TIGR02117 family)